MMLTIFEDRNHTLVLQEHANPWVIIYDRLERKEMSELAPQERQLLFDRAMAVEETMIAHFAPDKINIASFGNYLPKVHLHIQARFKEDDYFPEPLWGERKREGFCLDDTRLKSFVEALKEALA